MLISNLPKHFYVEFPNEVLEYKHIILILECYGYSLKTYSNIPVTLQEHYLQIANKTIILLAKYPTTKDLLESNGYVKIPLEEILKL